MGIVKFAKIAEVLNNLPLLLEKFSLIQNTELLEVRIDLCKVRKIHCPGPVGAK
jgi:hypothetical protein